MSAATAATTTASAAVRRGRNTMSKQKYKEFGDAVASILLASENTAESAIEDTKALILTALCQITQFDPHASTYDKEMVTRRREKTGKTTYELFKKKYYDEHQEAVNAKNAEAARLRRAALKNNSVTV